ncbi:galactonate dehydratase [Promicromonospora xylanilytica]
MPVLLGADSAINWLIVQVTDERGGTGLGEATLERQNSRVAAHVEALAGELRGQGLDAAIALTRRPATSLAEASALSALNQALWDLRARAGGLPLAWLLGDRPVSVPPLYANINRAIVGDRSPAAFVRVAQAAERDGYPAIKIAPFDDVEPRPLTDAAVRRAVDEGLARTAAVVEAVGVEVRIDLHWRFEVRAAVDVVAELAAMGLGWVEGPVREHDLDAWRQVRRSTECVLAGGETLTSAADLDGFLSASGVDVAMPDIKYCGGVDGFRQCLDVARRHGAQVSPHNPSGPVASLATVHAAGGQPLHSLEVAWRQVPSPLDVLDRGALTVPRGPGLGFELAQDAAALFPAHDEPDRAPTDLI